MTVSTQTTILLIVLILCLTIIYLSKKGIDVSVKSPQLSNEIKRLESKRKNNEEIRNSRIKNRPPIISVDGGVYPIRDENPYLNVDGKYVHKKEAIPHGDYSYNDGYSSFDPNDSSIPHHPGMITSVYPNACARYGSSSIYNDIYTYFPSNWCSIGYVTNPSYQAPYTTMTLQAQFYGNAWRYQVLDKINGVPIRLPDGTSGTGSNGTLRTGDNLTIPSKTGTWSVNIILDPTYVVVPF